MPDEKGVAALSLNADIPLGKPWTLYVMFVDLCRSTEFKAYCLHSKIPNGVWIERQLIFLHRVIVTMQRFGGTVVKTIGDEVMAYFPAEITANDVLRCGTNVHALFAAIDRYDAPEWRIELKASIDYGQVHDANFGLSIPGTIDPIGLVVDRCARLNKEGSVSQVVLSSSFFARLSAGDQARYSRLKEEKELRGLGMTEYYRIAVQ